MRLIIPLLIGFCLALEGREPPLGMWVWKQIHLESAEACGELLDFCEREEITHIDQHVSIKKGMLLNAEALRNFIIKAADHGISVNALRGECLSPFVDRARKRVNVSALLFIEPEKG